MQSYSNEKKDLLEKTLWINGKLNREIIAKSAKTIADKINLNIDNDIKILMVEEEGVGPKFLFSGEKLSPVLSVYKAKNFEHAKEIGQKILNYQGIGHSIGIHTNENKRALELGLELSVGRVIVNQAHTFATGGSFTNGLPFSLSMGCGTWQKNSIDNNLNYKHFMNVTKISSIIEGTEAQLKDYFEEYCKNHDPDELNNL